MADVEANSKEDCITQRGYQLCLDCLPEDSDEDINARDVTGMTALMLACAYGHVNCVDRLL